MVTTSSGTLTTLDTLCNREEHAAVFSLKRVARWAKVSCSGASDTEQQQIFRNIALQLYRKIVHVIRGSQNILGFSLSKSHGTKPEEKNLEAVKTLNAAGALRFWLPPGEKSIFFFSQFFFLKCVPCDLVLRAITMFHSAAKKIKIFSHRCREAQTSTSKFDFPSYWHVVNFFVAQSLTPKLSMVIWLAGQIQSIEMERTVCKTWRCGDLL